MNEKQQQLTFNEGITNVPSDAICSDNTLSDSIGLFYDNGEHRAIQKPSTMLTGVQGTVLFIHKIDGGDANDRYILRDGTDIVWRTKSGTSLTGGGTLLEETSTLSVKQVTTVGKTLILTTTQGLRYFIYKAADYGAVDDIPEPQVEFLLTDFRDNVGYDEGVQLAQPLGNIFDGVVFHTPYMTNQKAWNDFVVGQYARNKNAAAKVCRFVNPFFVRVAVEMYDHTYSRISAPILMVPNIRWNSEMKWKNKWSKDEALIRTWSCSLKYKLLTSYENYSDLVKGVVVFVSKEVETQKTTDDIPMLNAFQPVGILPPRYDGTLLTISEQGSTGRNTRWEPAQESYRTGPDIEDPGDWGTRHICHYTVGYYEDFYPVPIPRDQSDIIQDLKEVSIFYKLAELGRQTSNTWEDIKNVAESGVLENLTSRTALTSDNSSDYYDHTKLTGGFVHVYNSRLNLADVRRSFFDGYDRFMLYDDSFLTHQYNAYVTIRTDSNDSVVIKKTYTTSQKQGLWFYYPDPRATHVQIFRQSTGCVLDADLTEHKGLNGAYYLWGLPFDADYQEQVISGITEPLSYNNGESEELTNYVVASEVDNPYIFKSKGYVQVGVGRVKAISSITQAISQGQFGAYPLVAFTDNGVWALGINKEGIISDANPKEREVITSEEGVTQTDGAVFFSSAKGLMVVIGNQGGVEVKPVSTALANSDFATFLKTAFIAYDYRDSLLWIFDGHKENGVFVGSRYCWIYSIKNGTFARYDFGLSNNNPVIVTNVVNNYPDYLLQIGSTVYSLLNRPDINHDGQTSGSTFTPNTYSATLVTRPMKLENALALKSIMQVRHICDFPAGSGSATTMTIRIFASNNLHHWVELHSLRGTPWKYYKFQYDFTNMKATDRFAGTMLITQERRTNKLR